MLLGCLLSVGSSTPESSHLMMCLRHGGPIALMVTQLLLLIIVSGAVCRGLVIGWYQFGPLLPVGKNVGLMKLLQVPKETIFPCLCCGDEWVDLQV